VPEFGDQLATLFRAHFGADRVEKARPTMAGEDFSQYYRADNRIKSFFVFVEAVPPAMMAEAKAGRTTIPPLHSALWAPDAPVVINTGAKAMTVAALDILKKK
jgi:hippurate hydrolase